MKRFKYHKTFSFRETGGKRIVTLLLAAVCSFGVRVQANDLQENSYSLQIKNKTLAEAITIIQKETGCIFFYQNENIDQKKRISLNTQKLSLEKILDKLFANTDNTYMIDGNQVFVKKKNVESSGNYQERTQKKKISVSGVVMDAQDQPAIGASVIEKGTSNGVITDFDGNFTLNVTEGAEIVVSYVGSVAQSFLAKENQLYNISLKEDPKMMEEVVVIGYGTQRRSLVTSAISTFKPTENTRRVVNPGEMLDGTVAGVTIAKTSGNLGTGLSFNIRGAGSLTAGNDPLVVVDGIPLMRYDANVNDFGESMSSMATINTEDIESIEILKDAASAAIYGSRATNGVVLITTKSGKEGKSKFDLNVSMGFSQFPNRDNFKMSDSKLYVEVVNEGRTNYNTQNNLTPASSGYQYPITNPFGDMPDYDWLGGVLQTAQHYNVSASFSGGDKKTTFYLGGNYTSEDGLIRTNHLNKLSLKANVKHKMSSWLEIGANTSAVYLQNNRIPGSGLGTNTIGRTITQRPFDKPYKPNGDYYVGGTSDLTYHNMVQILEEEVTTLDNLRYLGNFFGTVNIWKGLQFKSSFSVDVAHTDDYINYNERHPYGKSIGVISEDMRLMKSYLLENYLTYNSAWKKLEYSVMAGHSFQDIETKSTGIEGQDFASPSLDVTTSAAEIISAGSNVTGSAMESYFGRINMSYEDKYLFAMTMRADGSSKFHPDRRWGYFPSVSIGWTMSNEAFWKETSTDLKLRASYGKTGNQEAIGRYSWRDLMTGGASYNKSSGIAASTTGNPSLVWESADQYDVGFDLSLLNGKINMMTDFYLKNTFELLWNKKVPPTLGDDNILSNVGSMRNVGLEYTLNTQFQLGKVKWGSSFNIAHNKNKLLSLATKDSAPHRYSIRAYIIGEEVGIWYMPKALGIYQTEDEIPDNIKSKAFPGDVKYLDIDENGKIDSEDYVILGSSNPKVTGGWNNTFSYKGFDLNILLSFKYGHKVYSSALQQSSRIGGTWGLTEVAALNRWTGPGTSDTYPRAMPTSTWNDQHSSRFLQDGSFLRLRSLTLGYNVPANVISKLGIKQLRGYIQGDNLFLITAKDYIGYDPESMNNTNAGGYQGYDNYIVPQPRTITLGLNISF